MLTFLKKIASVASISLALTLTFSCSSDDGDGGSGGGGGGGGGGGSSGTVIDAAWLDSHNWTIGENFKVTSYTIESGLYVPNGKTLTILPGVTINMATTSSSINVEEGGTIKAKGLPFMLDASGEATVTSGRITLTRKDGKWGRIAINSITENELDYVDLINGGNGDAYYDCTLYLYGGVASITNSLIDGSGSNGITTYDNGYFAVFENNAINNSAKAPIYAESKFWSLRKISGNNTYTGNTNNYVHVASPGSINADMTIIKTSIPYRVDATFTIEDEATLTVEPGTEIRFGNASSGIKVEGSAAIIMNGDADNRIVLKGLTASKGAWRSIAIHSSRTENMFNYVDIINGGSGSSDYDCALYLYSGVASITNTTIDGSGSNGITTYDTGYLLKFENNTISNSVKAPIYTESRISSVHNLGAGNIYTGNAKNYIHIPTSDYISENMTLTNQGIPYYLENGLNVSGDNEPVLTIEPGVVITVGGQKRIHAHDNGRIHAVGTETDSIVFRGSQAQSGWWHGIIVDSKVVGTKLAYCSISGAGRTGTWAENSGIYIYNAYIELLNVNISKSNWYGIGIEGDENFIWSSGVTFTDVTKGNVWYYDGGVIEEELPANNFTPSDP